MSIKWTIHSGKKINYTLTFGWFATSSSYEHGRTLHLVGEHNVNLHFTCHCYKLYFRIPDSTMYALAQPSEQDQLSFQELSALSKLKKEYPGIQIPCARGNKSRKQTPNSEYLTMNERQVRCSFRKKKSPRWPAEVLANRTPAVSWSLVDQHILRQVPRVNRVTVHTFW